MGSARPKISSEEPSSEVVEACRRGDRRALEDVLHRYTPELERLLIRLIGPEAEVDDILQNALMAVVAAFPRYRGEASLRTWMTRIAVRSAADALRRPQRRRTVLQVVPALEVAGTPPEHGPDRRAVGRWQLSRVYEHLSAMPPKRRVPLILHVLEGYPIEEVAALTGTTRAATKSRIFWARRALVAKARRDPLLREWVAGSEASG